MKRLAALLFFCLMLAPLHAASPLLTLDNMLVASPAGVGARAPQVVTTENGLVSLSWIEPGLDDKLALHFARFDPETFTWDKPNFVGPTSDSSVPEQSLYRPVTATNGGRIATVWFVSDKNDPHVLLSISPDAGAHFLMPLLIEDTRPLGAPDLAMLADGTVFVSWLEHYGHDEAAIWLRRVSPGGERSVPVLLATLPNDRTHPRLALLRGNAGASIKLLLVYTVAREDVSQIVTRLLSIAPPPVSAAAKDCNCPTSDEAARGYPLRAHIVALQREHSTLTIRHEGISGVLPAGAAEFKVAPELFNMVATNADIFARAELRGSDWWLIDVRLIVRTETTTSPHR